MKARTLIATAGALVALVAVSAQTAGAKVTTACALTKAHSTVGYGDARWTYPVSIRKVLVVGNGTKAPYYQYVPVRSGCGGGAKG